MKKSPNKVIKLTVYLFAFFLYFSCSPDKDLFTEAILDDSISIEEFERNNSGFVSKTVIISPINDAFIQDSKGYDQSVMRLQEKFHTAYVMFDLRPINGDITDVTFQFTIDGDPGDGEINIYKGLSNNWDESNLNQSNAPGIDILVGAVNKSFPLGVTENIPLNSTEILPEKITLILSQISGNNLAIASKEHPSDIGPKLIVTYQSPIGAEETIPDVDSDDQTMGELKAFPAAYGGGSIATGGRGGTLVIVNTLNFNAPLVYDETYDVYEGGIRAALIADIGPRYIVFSVSGVIDGGNEEIYKEHAKDITLLGQSAPQGGVTLYRGWIDLNFSSNIIMRYLTIRSGVASGNPIEDDQSSSPFQIGHKNIIMDHCSASWGGDKGIMASEWQSGYPLQNITVQNCLIADSHTLGFSVDGINGGAGDWDVAGNISWHYNFMAGGNRTPNLGGFDGLGVIQNNLVQSNGSKLSTIVYGDPKINHVGNYYYIHHASIVPNRFQDLGSNNATIYSKGNYYENLMGVQLNGTMSENNEKIWINTRGDQQLATSFFTETINTSSIPNEPPTLTAQQTKTQVLANAGANKYMDDEGRAQSYTSNYDQIAKSNFESGILTFRHFASDWSMPEVPQNTRPADFDTDKDGMADAWERREIGDLSQSYNHDHDGDGYPNIEEYLNQVDF